MRLLHGDLIYASQGFILIQKVTAFWGLGVGGRNQKLYQSQLRPA